MDGDLQAIGAGPLILVLMGRTAIFPICLTEGSSLKAEWYACRSVRPLDFHLVGGGTYGHRDCELCENKDTDVDSGGVIDGVGELGCASSHAQTT